MIALKNINKRFGEHILFKDYTIDFQPGEVVAIIGPSGCGKTTLLRIIAGLDKAFTGTVNGRPNDISYLFQESRLLPWKNVSDNIRFVVKDIMASEAIDRQVDELMALSYLNGHAHKYPAELSGGMQRRVALCRSFIYPSSLLLMDEPFSGLDAKMKDKIADRFLSLLNPSTTTIIVTHDEHIINKCDRIVALV